MPRASLDPLQRGLLVACAAVVLGLAALSVGAKPAAASQLIARNARDVSLLTNARGQALIGYTVGGKRVHVLAWGAVNATAPTRGGRQVQFRFEHSSGAGFHGSCLPYDGPPLAWKVVACTSADGSYWALQAWQRGLPDYGARPTPSESAWELRLSHWTGALPALSITVDWAYRRYDHLFGTFSYGGTGVFGFAASSSGVPLDAFGRNIYVDTFDSAYGRGWRRENSFLTHEPHGSFCYGFYPHGGRPSGQGTRYRATAEGPGVAPDVSWSGNAPGPFNARLEATDHRELAALGDHACRPA